MVLKLLAAMVVAGFWAAGCAQESPAHPMPMLPSLTLDSAVKAAFADASQRTGLAIEALRLHSAAAVYWRDGSLGCPQPGRVYAQALVPGYRVRIRTPEHELDYHAASRGSVVLCPADRAVEPLPDDDRR